MSADVRLPWLRRGLAVLACAGCVLFLVPGHLGLWRVYPFTQLSSMRMLTALGLLAGAVGCLVWAARVPSRRRVRPSTTTAVVAATSALVTVATLASSGAFAEGRAGSPTAEADLTVLSLNARSVEGPRLAAVVRSARADVVMLLETPDDVVEDLVQRLGGADAGWQAAINADQTDRGFDAVGLLVSDRLGTYRQADGPTLDSGAVAMVGSGPGPRHLAAVHPPPPVSRFASAQRWASQLRTAVGWCERAPDSVVGGDFNAIVDHLRRSGLDRCASATDRLGLSAHGTWPTSLPRWLGAGIDHQLHDRAAWRPVSARVLEVGVTDHRALVVRYADLRP